MKIDKVDPAKTILDAALETILADKISGARLRQVARQAGMSQGNLHYYYPTKDELYSALLDHLLEVFVDERRAILSDRTIAPAEKLSFFFQQQKELIRRRREVIIFFDFWVQATADLEIAAKISGMYARWRDDICQVLEEGVQAGSFSAKAAAQMPAILASLMDGATLQSVIDEGSLDLEAYFDAAYETAMRMLEVRS